MVKYSDDTEYEMIELASLFDLDKARIVQAQINSIDSGNNCAAITFSSECVELAGLSVDAVKFFYHCENSTGTEEDLVNGHKAFKANEYVYCLWCPASPSVDERFFIIGHVDIRGTKRCGYGDFIVMSMGLDYTFGPHTGIAPTERYITIFDVAGCCVVNPSTFPVLDGSPPAPTAFPCKVDDAVTEWINFNFSNVTGLYYCPLYVEPYTASISVSSTINYPVEYSGCSLHWKISYSDGGYEDHYADADWSDPVGGYYNRVDSTRENYWVIPVTRRGWVMTDGVTNDVHYAYTGGERTITSSGYCIRGGNAVASAHVEHFFRYKSTFDNVDIVKESFSATAPMGPGFSAVRYQGLDFGGQYAVSLSGDYGFYVILGGSETYRSRDINPEIIGGEGSVSVPCEEGIGVAEILPYPPWEGDSVNARASYHTMGHSYCMVAMFDDVEGEKGPILSPTRCLSVMNHTLSRGMEEAFAPLKRKVFDLTNDTRTYGAWAWEKPTLGVVKKKVA